MIAMKENINDNNNRDEKSVAIVMKGLLQTKNAFGQWKTRSFVLTEDGMLKYYTSPEREKVRF
jgi:hypothetical protein